MPQLNVNFDDVADEIKSVPPGHYTAEIFEVPEITPTAKGDSENLITKLRITSEGEFNGRTITSYIWLGSKIGETQAKRVFLSAGLPATGKGQTEDLLGKTVEIIVQATTYTKDGEERISSKVKDFITS